ncbi:hypothetical protein ZWY2020_037404 [Hordeum vulgare]|nr:hypothetical protein ZWY2020_037404 [Hordeum vulgare]
MVWAKVRGYPRWPGQVFDPADASALALRERRATGAALVACFGDRSFLWADAAELTLLRDNFPRLAGVGLRSNNRVEFAPALDDALAEVARRVKAGLSCGCGSAAKRQVFHNTGLRRDVPGAAVSAGFARDALRGEAFLEYVHALAVAPGDGANRLDHAVAAAQLEAFNRWRGKNVLVLPDRASRPATPNPKRTARARGQDHVPIDSMELYAKPAGQADDVAGSAREVAGGMIALASSQGSSMVFSAGNRTMTTCPDATVAATAEGGIILNKENSGCEDDVNDNDAPSHETMVSCSRWKDCVIVLTFIVLTLLVYPLMME